MLVSHVTYVLSNFLFVIGYALGLSLGAYLYSRGQVTIGAAYLIVYYIGMLAGPLDSIREQAEDLQQATASLGRTSDLLRLQPQIRDNHQIPKIQNPQIPSQGERACSDALRAQNPLPRLVTFDNVSFSYGDEGRPTTTPPCAACRSTWSRARCWACWAAPAAARRRSRGCSSACTTRPADRIRLDGVDLRDLPLAELRRRVGMVTQDVQLFQATVRDNLTFFDRHIGDDQIERILRDLQLWDWVQSLPHGLDTPLAAGAGAARDRGCRPAKRSSWPLPASLCTTPAWSSWTKPRRGSTRRPKPCWSEPSTACSRAGPGSSSPTACARSSAPITCSSWPTVR